MNLSTITKSATLKPPRTLIYGPAGVGKTTFGADAPKPIFLPVEDGLGRIEVDHFPTPKTYAEVKAALDALVNEDHQFKTVVIDSLDWLEPLIWRQTCEANKWQSIEQPGYGRGYVEALRYWREIMDRLNYLRDAKKMATILIAHAQVRRFEAPDAEAFDRYDIKLQKKAADLVCEHSDAIFFASFKYSTVKVEERGRVRARGQGDGERVMYCEERPSWVAKNRYALPAELPLSWAAFMTEAFKR